MKKYKLDYRVETELHENKKPTKQIIYTGTYYYFSILEAEKKKTIKKQFFLTITILCFFLIGGMLNNGGSRMFYIVLPYICLFLPIVYLLMGVVNFITTPPKMEFGTYDKSIMRIKRTSKGIKWISSYVFIGNCIFLISQGKDLDWFSESTFLFINAMMFIQSFLLNKEINSIDKTIIVEKQQTKNSEKT